MSAVRYNEPAIGRMIGDAPEPLITLLDAEDEALSTTIYWEGGGRNHCQIIRTAFREGHRWDEERAWRELVHAVNEVALHGKRGETGSKGFQRLFCGGLEALGLSPEQARILWFRSPMIMRNVQPPGEPPQSEFLAHFTIAPRDVVVSEVPVS